MIAACKGVFDGDTIAWEMFLNGESIGFHWSTNSMIVRAKKLGAVWENNNPPAISHMPHPDDVPIWFPDYKGETNTYSGKYGLTGVGK